MATQVFLLPPGNPASTHLGNNTTKLDGTAGTWRPNATSPSRGSGAVGLDTNTVNGPTSGVEVGPASQSGHAAEWLTPPVDQDVTISGVITGNIWASENSMSANVAINFRVQKVSAIDRTLTNIVTSARTTELGTTEAVNNFTATPGAGVTLNKGDRLRITLFGDDSAAATMATGFTFSATFGGPSAGASGDTYITFNETFGFQTTDPSGTTVYPTDTASAVATAAVDREAWTARGGSALTDPTTSPGGWTAPFQATDTSGGTVVDWWTRPLQAFTLSGLVKCNVRARESAGTVNGSIGVEIARVDGDGTNPVVWGYANRDASTASGSAGEVATTETAYTIYVAGDDLAISDGQRLRIRLYGDDCADAAIVSGSSAITFLYNGPTGGASGDMFLVFPQTLVESTGATNGTATPATVARTASVPAATGAGTAVAKAECAMRWAKIITESFTGADAQLDLGTFDQPWAVVQAATGLNVVSGKVRGTAVGPARARAENDLGSRKMYAKADFSGSDFSAAQNSNIAAVASEGDNTQIDFYIFQVQLNSINGTGNIFRTVNGVSTNIKTQALRSGVGFVQGQVYRMGIEVDGADIRCYIDGNLEMSHTDTTAPAIFDPGTKAGFATQDSTASGYVEVDNWEAGLLGVAGASVPQATAVGTTGGGDGAATPSAVAATASVLVAQGQGVGLASPAAVARSASVPAATGAGPGVALPATVARTATIPATDEVGNAAALPAAVARTASVPAATGQGAGLASPASVARTAAVPSALGVLVGLATPSTVAAVAAVPSASSVGAGVSLGTSVVSTASVPTSTAAGAGLASPTPVTRSASVPAATASTVTDVAATPATVARAATIPASSAAGTGVGLPSVAGAIASVPAALGVNPGLGSPATVARVASIPTATGQGSATATPGATAGAAARPAATGIAGATGTPTTVARASTVPQATASSTGDGTAVATTVARTANVGASTGVGNAVNIPAVVARTSAVPAVTPLGQTVAFPPTVARTTSVPVVTVSGTGVASPSTNARLGAVPQATGVAAGNGVATPTAVVRSAAIPAVVGMGGAAGSPGSLSRTSSVPAALALGSARALPTPVAGFAALPAALSLGGAMASAQGFAALGNVPLALALVGQPLDFEGPLVGRLGRSGMAASLSGRSSAKVAGNGHGGEVVPGGTVATLQGTGARGRLP